MSKFHINSKTGRVNICRAEVKECPVGTTEDHYASKEEAYSAREKQLAEEHGTFSPGLKKKISKANDLLRNIESYKTSEKWTRIPGEGNFKQISGSDGVVKGSIQAREGMFILGSRDTSNKKLIRFDKSNFETENDAVEYFQDWSRENWSVKTGE